MAARRTTKQTESENTMTDTQTEAPENTETPDTENTEPEAGTEAAGHKFNTGDEATVIRGKLRGRKGVIMAYSEADQTYAVTLDGGTLAVVNAKNLKAPVDSTVSVKAIVSALAEFGQTPEDRDAANRLAAALDAVVPGVSVKLNEAMTPAA